MSMFAEPRGEMATPTETDVIYHYRDGFFIQQHLLDFGLFTIASISDHFWTDQMNRSSRVAWHNNMIHFWFLVFNPV